MKNRFFSYFSVIGVCLSCLNFSAFANPIVKKSLIVAVIGENEEDNNKVASWMLENNDDVEFKDVDLIKFDHSKLYEAKNNPNFKVAVITYNPNIDNDFNKIPSIFRDKFDCMDIIIHVSNKNTFTFKKIKGFYDKLNEAVIGEDVYKTMVYSNFGESARFELWRYMQNKFDTKQFRYLFFIYNGAKEELIKLKDYNALDSYISGMPDARSIHPIDLNGKNTKIISNFVNNFGEQRDALNENQTLGRIQKLKKKLQNGAFRLGNRPTQEQSKTKCCWTNLTINKDPEYKTT